VCWGVVLSKFQDPQSEGNGQSIPIKSNHKYFPVKQYNEEATSDELWNLLHRHVTSAYGSFKNAFLQMDEVCVEYDTAEWFYNINCFYSFYQF